MKKIFIYYSLTGNGDIVASNLKEKGFEVYKVETKHRALPKNFAMSIVKGGFIAFLGVKTKIKHIDVNLDEYDEVYIGSPIWNDRLACPTNSILDELNLIGKELTFVLYSGSGKNVKAKEKIMKLYPNAKIIDLQEPKKYSEGLNKI